MCTAKIYISIGQCSQIYFSSLDITKSLTWVALWIFSGCLCFWVQNVPNSLYFLLKSFCGKVDIITSSVYSFSIQFCNSYPKTQSIFSPLDSGLDNEVTWSGWWDAKSKSLFSMEGLKYAWTCSLAPLLYHTLSSLLVQGGCAKNVVEPIHRPIFEVKLPRWTPKTH